MQRNDLYRVVSGKIIKKYKCLSALAYKTGLDRHCLSKVKGKSMAMVRSVRRCKRWTFDRKVRDFFERDDNSRAQPGKSDVKKNEKGEKSQTRVLTDYLDNLFRKFRSENPEVKISLATFKRMRPKHILLMSLISRHTCLCTKHQNMALIAKAMKAAGLDVPLNPEHLIKEDVLGKAKEFFSKDDRFQVNQWKRVEIEEKGKKKYVTKIIEQSFENMTLFLEFLEKQTDDFKGHVSRVINQYDQIHTLKGNLPQHHVLIQMDFAENYSCKSLEEVQSAYFNQASVTLHPIVIYFNTEYGIDHKSIIIVSDELGHNSTTVLTFVDKIIPIVQDIDPEASTIHYWTDSPTSQYRNKSIIDFVANHESCHGMKARWNYFESGHGKGPCDGLGGTVKRLADEAMRSGKVLIQDANGFYQWAKSSSMKNVTFVFVPSTECDKKRTELNEWQSALKPIKGTMKLHAVVGLGNSKVKVRDVSCYCAECLSGDLCNGWSEATTRTIDVERHTIDVERNTIDVERNTVEGMNVSCSQRNESFKIGDYVAAFYDVHWYVGKIVDTDDNEFEISFMEKKKNLYRWPSKPDEIWVDADKIVCKIDEPKPTGKSSRLFKLAIESQAKITESI